MKDYRIRIFSRHPSHNILRKNLPKLNFRSIVRFGSITEINNGLKYIELNSVESIKISSNKRKMKEKFDIAGVPTAPWFNAGDVDDIVDFMEELEIPFPIVCKSLYGSQGVGNTLINSQEELEDWASNKNLNNYIYEKYIPYGLEYRLHITKNGCFYTCRKALKSDAETKDRWRRHKDNSIWLLESNPDFRKPNSWGDIVSNCVLALKTIGADVLSFDIKVQANTNKPDKYQKFIILESNSASSMQSPIHNDISICAQKYLDIIPTLLKNKKEGENNNE